MVFQSSQVFLYPTNSTGVKPASALVMGNDGFTLFGTATIGGGTNGEAGNIFKIHADGSGFQVLHLFTGGASDGALGDYSSLTSPKYRSSGYVGGLLLAQDGSLYGVTYYGGTNNCGTIYKIRQDGGGFQIIHNFSTIIAPITTLLQTADGVLYGTGMNNVVFKLNTDGSGYHESFLSGLPGDGVLTSPLIQAADGLLYGCADNGQSFIFKVSTNLNDAVQVRAFTLTEASILYGTLYQAPNGMLLGTSAKTGGSHGNIFMLDTNGGNFQVVHSFLDGSTPDDGHAPCSGLRMGPDGWLYGTASDTIGTDSGTIYRILPDGSNYSIVYNITVASDGQIPLAPLTMGTFQGTTGALFGVTSLGGATTGSGTVFSVLVNPPVSITPGSITAGGQTTLFWPSWAATYQLQSTTNLASGNWQTITNGTSVVGVTVPASNSATYYRLVSPP